MTIEKVDTNGTQVQIIKDIANSFNQIIDQINLSATAQPRRPVIPRPVRYNDEDTEILEEYGLNLETGEIEDEEKYDKLPVREKERYAKQLADKK